MNHPDEALTISNPRLLAAIYFSLLAIIATIILDTIFYSLGIEQILPVFQAILLATAVAAIFGALFGEKMVHSSKPYQKHVFFLAVLMFILALPCYILGLFILIKLNQPHLYDNATFLQIFYTYLVYLAYAFILVGIWFALLTGLAAIYLRRYLVYYLLDTLNIRRTAPGQTVVGDKTAKHGQTTISSEAEHNHHSNE